ncbi:MAG TPA: di-heme-cytochrome C peroxidase [Longimicrobium sp.]|jgi:hypothetical protein
MVPKSYWLPLVGAGIMALLAGCDQKTKEPEAGTTDPPSSTEPRPLTSQERKTFYHLTEGSEVIPLDWVRALRDSSTGRPFLENPERFGLIADSANAYRLPVGVTAGPTVDTRFLGVQMLGFNCSACHVNEVTYQGKRIRIDGGPSRFDADGFKAALAGNIRYTIRHPKALLRFIYDQLRLPAPKAGPETFRLPRSRDPAATQALQSLSDDTVTPQEEAFLAALEEEIRADESRFPAVDLEKVPFDSTHPANQQLRARYSHVEGGRAESRFRESLDARESEVLQSLAPPASRALSGSLAEAFVVARLLRDRVATLTGLSGEKGGSGPPDGPGRVDAFGVARNRIYPQRAVPTNAPVSYPHLWGFGQQAWLHWDANTNSVMERNLGQALGVGAVYDKTSMRSTLNPVHIHQLEKLARLLPEPGWPAAFPPIDSAKARQGAPLFGQRCAGCHADKPAGDPCYPLAVIRTDSMRAVNFATPLGNGRFTDSVAPVLHALKTQAYRTFKVPASQQAEMNGIPDSAVVWRTTRMYGSRPLRGIWATAPFLHNGSVPSLYELLLPVGRRSPTFPVGHAEFDPVKVGYVTTAQPGSATYDTKVVGNANTGHEYGTDLPEEARLALLEYLKTLGSYTGVVAPQQGAVSCPSLHGTQAGG